MDAKASTAVRHANRLTFVAQCVLNAKTVDVEAWPAAARGAWRKLCAGQHTGTFAALVRMVEARKSTHVFVFAARTEAARLRTEARKLTSQVVHAKRKALATRLGAKGGIAQAYRMLRAAPAPSLN
eukprot:10094106-Alexandrium_andersonii.AAC.1